MTDGSRTRVQLGLLALVTALALALGGCGDDVGCPDCGGDPPAYLPLDSPENVMANLEVSYRRKEIDRYVILLHPDFLFRFQPGDVQDIGVEFWNRATDSLKTACLFASPEVTWIDIDISAFTPPAPPADPDPGLEGTTVLRVNRTFLEIDTIHGVTWQVDGDIQDLFLVRGDGAETDSTRWYILEWRDIAGNGLTAAAGQPTTFGKLKEQFGDCDP